MDKRKIVRMLLEAEDSAMKAYNEFSSRKNFTVTSLYITGKMSGVTEISKKSEYAVPPVLDTSSETLKVTLGSWSTALLICLESVTIS